VRDWSSDVCSSDLGTATTGFETWALDLSIINLPVMLFVESARPVETALPALRTLRVTEITSPRALQRRRSIPTSVAPTMSATMSTSACYDNDADLRFACEL
jgi:hypothetical protein